jgi:ribosomal protein L40E
MPLRADSPMLLNMTWVPRRASLMQSCQVCKHCYEFQNKGVATCPPAETQQLRPKRRTKSELTSPILPQRHPGLPTAARHRSTTNRFFADPASGSPHVVELVITSQVLRNQSRSRIEEGGGPVPINLALLTDVASGRCPRTLRLSWPCCPKPLEFHAQCAEESLSAKLSALIRHTAEREKRRSRPGFGQLSPIAARGREPGRTNVDFP